MRMNNTSTLSLFYRCQGLCPFFWGSPAVELSRQLLKLVISIISCYLNQLRHFVAKVM